MNRKIKLADQVKTFAMFMRVIKRLIVKTQNVYIKVEHWFQTGSSHKNKHKGPINIEKDGKPWQ